MTSKARQTAPDGAAALSQQYFERDRIEAEQSLEDGFRDAGPGVDPNVSGSFVALDRQRDAALERFVGRCRKKLRKAKDEATQVMVLGLLVSDACGRSGIHASDLAARHASLAREHRSSDTGEVLLGNLLADRVQAGGEKPKRNAPAGAALAPHRALLFKSVADWSSLPRCTLERREATPAERDGAVALLQAAAWNVVQIGQAHFIVDLMFDPGALYEDHSQKAQDYRRLLSELEGGQVQYSNARAPSSRKELTGHMPRPPWHVELWELDIQRGDRIGRGGFGEVFHGRWAGTHMAIKEIKDTTPTDADVVDFILEIALLSQLNHPNIVRFWRGCTGVRDGNRCLLMVTEYVKQGGLSRLLHGHGGPPLPAPLTLPQALSFGLDIARGVQYLHGQRILHLDLKSPNVLCALPWKAKLCDFGLAKIRGEHTVVQSTLQGVSPVWAPPEMFDDKAGGLTEKADVYSFAIIFFELLTKRVPFQEVNGAQLPSLKLAGTLPRLPAGMPEDCVDLINQCCAARPSSRPSMCGVIARLREVAQTRGVQFSEVRPPAGFSGADDAEALRAREREDVAAQQLVELDGHLAKLRVEMTELQRRLEQVRRRGAELAGPADDSWCDAFVHEVAGSKFRCTICSKLFRGPEFVRRHVLAKHDAEVRRASEDAYFDCDVSNEDSMPAHRSLRVREGAPLRPAPATAVGEGRFSQALQDAAEKGSLQKVAELLETRADPCQQDDGGTGPILVAARTGNVAVMEALIAAAEHVGTCAAELVKRATGAGITPLHAAAGEGHSEVVSALLQRGAPVDVRCARGKTPLLHAGENGHAAACELLVRARADPTSRTRDGETLLHVAARFGDASLVSQALSLKASLTAQDQDGWTPLHEAAHWGAAAVQALCAARANVHARSGDGETPLHVALEGYEQASSCEVLLRWRADPSATDVDGEGPLHVAVRHDNGDACRLLLASAAQVNSRDHSGRTPFDLAKHADVRELLIANGGSAGSAAAPGVA